MKRYDLKFAFHEKILPEILTQCQADYRILDTSGVRISQYHTLYFDTPERRFFLDHHHEKAERFKVRMRNYKESSLFFLEVKRKKNEQSFKSRIALDAFSETIPENAREFLLRKLPSAPPLWPALHNHFRRITLVHRTEKERVTFDVDIRFSHQNTEVPLPQLTIAEVKQEKPNRNSTFIQLMKKYGIRESGLSKYCCGSVLTQPDLKYNNFKEKILLIRKITQAA